MPEEDHGPTIKDDDQYEALRREGGQQGEGRAHRQHRSRETAGKRGGQSPRLRGLDR